jgi:hypothetical protein
MIRLKHLLTEIESNDLAQLLDKIKNKQFRLFGQGDNGRVYEIDDTDLLFKITDESAEYEVASVIIGRSQEFSTFIPVHYVDGKNMYILSKANPLSGQQTNDIESFLTQFKEFARSEGGEVSIFDYLDADGARSSAEYLVNFLRALQQDIQKTGIADLDLDLDFKTDNVMVWQEKLVLIDW